MWINVITFMSKVERNTQLTQWQGWANLFNIVTWFNSLLQLIIYLLWWRAPDTLRQGTTPGLCSWCSKFLTPVWGCDVGQRFSTSSGSSQRHTASAAKIMLSALILAYFNFNSMHLGPPEMQERKTKVDPWKLQDHGHTLLWSES